MLTAERKKAEKEHSRAGLLTAANATEEARKQWVKDELVRIGTERARSLGWTDCYTFTKAMGERVVERWATSAAGLRRTSIVRPSIIESALAKPHVGWIEGFTMAEPLILAYGRGELPEFPASADTIVDLVPVDHVVSAIVAVLAHPPEPGRVGYFHVSSGDRNPLTFNTLYSSVRTYFDRHPFTAGDRGAARLPEWRFPGARSVERLLSTSEKAWKVADYAIGHAPRSDRARDLARKLHQQGRRLEFLRRYLNLYMEYATAELRFSDSTRWRSSAPCPRRTRPRSRSTPRSSTGRTTSSRCTARRSPHRCGAWTSCGRCAGGRRPTACAGSAARRPASRRSSTWTGRCSRPT